MRDRPLCSFCLFSFLLIFVCVLSGGAKFLKELRPSVLEQIIPQDAQVRLTGQVYDIELKEKYQILYLKNISVIYQNKSLKESRIIIYDEEKLNIEIGNQLEVGGSLSFYEKERNPGNFNQKLYYQKQGICASVWASDIRIADDKEDTLRCFLYKFRMRWKSLIFENMEGKDGEVLAAMLLAEKTGMDADVKELYQANGIGHILAISGLHLSIIGIGLYQFFRRTSGSYILGGFAGICFLIFYIIMIGVTVSVLRAVIMFLFRVGADMTGRHYDSPTALSVAALVTVIWNPLYFYDGGFWLSYGAILAIILVLPVFEELIFQSFWSSFSIAIVTLPILLFYFFEIPPYSVILNLIVIPFMTLVILCGLLGSVLCLSGVSMPLGKVLLEVCSIIFRIYEVCCKMFLELPSARIVAGQPMLWQVALYYGSFLLLVVMWRKKQKWMIAGIMVILSATLMFFPVSMNDNLSVTVLDIGQGDCIFVKGPEGDTYLIDGGSSDVKNVGKYRIEPFLKSQGTGKIDYVFVTHGDGDHTNAIEEMIDRMNIGVCIETIVFPDKRFWDEKLYELARHAMSRGVKVVTMKEGEKLKEGEMMITCLAPGDKLAKLNTQAEGNLTSMVLALEYKDFDMLFTGDVEEEGEKLLTEELKEFYGCKKWDVLKVAHHGSKNSTSEAFLEMTEPSYAVISAGRDNSYGHPHQETLERLRCFGSTVLSTQENGAVTIETNGKKMDISCYLK